MKNRNRRERMTLPIYKLIISVLNILVSATRVKMNRKVHVCNQNVSRRFVPRHSCARYKKTEHGESLRGEH